MADQVNPIIVGHWTNDTAARLFANYEITASHLWEMRQTAASDGASPESLRHIDHLHTECLDNMAKLYAQFSMPAVFISGSQNR